MVIKGEPYTPEVLLCGDNSVSSFFGGTAFLTYFSITDYRHWHAPVNGTIKRITNVPGTYFPLSQGTAGNFLLSID
jgi:phosphatidylserine decarboxylase